MSICYASLVIGITNCSEPEITATDARLQTQHPIVLIWEEQKDKPKDEITTSQEGEPTKPSSVQLNSEHPSKLLIQKVK